ncbi:MAG: CoA transferase, partial [Aeriscardovia sp.]|nr:CoA transferase [Aeriscardovia sp.]
AKGWDTDPNDYVYIVIQDPKSSWEAMCNTIGKPQLINDPRFDTWQHRQLHKDELYAEIEDFTKNYDKFTLTEMFSKAGLPCRPIMDWYELEHDPDLNSDGTIVTIDEGGNRGNFKTIGLPWTMSNYKPDYKRAPDLGENNKEILTGLGFSESDIQGMLADGTISEARGPKNAAPEVIK